MNQEETKEIIENALEDVLELAMAMTKRLQADQTKLLMLSNFVSNLENYEHLNFRLSDFRYDEYDQLVPIITQNGVPENSLVYAICYAYDYAKDSLEHKNTILAERFLTNRAFEKRIQNLAIVKDFVLTNTNYLLENFIPDSSQEP